MTEKRRCRAGLRSPMIIREITVGPIGTCCYLILNEEQNACVLIDPGAEPERIRKAVGSSRLSAIREALDESRQSSALSWETS